MDKKKTILNSIVMLAIFGATMYYVFHGQDMHALLAYMKEGNPYLWLAAVFTMLMFMVFDAVILWYLLRSLKQAVKFTRCVLYSFIGSFFSGITPSASGGQPMMLVYMQQDGLSISVASMVLLMIAITYKAVLIIVGGLVVIVRPASVMPFIQPVMGWVYLGIALNIITVVFFVILVFHNDFAEWLLFKGIALLTHFRIFKNREKWLNKGQELIGQYKGAASFLKANWSITFIAFLLTCLQRFCIFFVTYIVYRSFGLSEHGMWQVLTLQAVIILSVELLPLPGGMGISESLFLKVFEPIMGAFTLPSMIVSRGLSYYTRLLTSAVMTGVAHMMIIGRRGKKK